MYTLLCSKWITNKDLYYIAHEFCSMSCTRLEGGGDLRENGYMYMYGFSIHLKLTQHC